MFLPSDYDNRGWFKLPALFWAVLLLQARTWALAVRAGGRVARAGRGAARAILP